MPLPEWGYPPEPGFEHGDNYSSLEIVWKHADGRVVLQVPPAELEATDAELEVTPADVQPVKRGRFLRRRARD